MTTTVRENGLPLEAQPWARDVEKSIRNLQTTQEMVAQNGEQAIIAAGTAVTGAANSAAAQAAAIAEMRRVPATLDASKVTLTPSAYFDASGTPWGRIDVDIVPNDLDTDGNPLIPAHYEVFGRVFVNDPTLDPSDHTSFGPTGPGYLPMGTSSTTRVHVEGLQVGVEYQLRFVAVSSFGVSSSQSDWLTATTPATLAAMDVPNAPVLESGAGIVVARWDGLFGSAQPPEQFRGVHLDVSPAGASAWTRQGSPIVRGGGSIQVGGLTVGSAYDFSFVGFDSLGVETDRSAVSTITVIGIDSENLAPELVTLISSSGGGNHITFSTAQPVDDGTAAGDLWFQRDENAAVIAQWVWDGQNWTPQTMSHEVITSVDLGTATVGQLDGAFIKARSMAANALQAGTITVNELSPTIGDDLGLAAKGSVNILAGQVGDLTAAQQGTAAALALQQTLFQVKPDGAYISSPGSASAGSQLALRNTGVQLLQNGAVVSDWNQGQMHVDSFVGNEVILGAHKLEKLNATDTVVRAL
ncbi:hypothetical protein [Pseudolysinimonas sp.]|uniref:hypothetical protein n=1 Tax=Pseudolysinimonas sp. TaxID=2680009 RepID=UPI003F7F2000